MSSPLAFNIIMRAGLNHPFKEMGEQVRGWVVGGFIWLRGPKPRSSRVWEASGSGFSSSSPIGQSWGGCSECVEVWGGPCFWLLDSILFQQWICLGLSIIEIKKLLIIWCQEFNDAKKIMEEIETFQLRKFSHLPEKLKIRGDLERIHRKTVRTQKKKMWRPRMILSRGQWRWKRSP